LVSLLRIASIFCVIFNSVLCLISWSMLPFAFNCKMLQDFTFPVQLTFPTFLFILDRRTRRINLWI
jgi:hypothetical protein